MFIVVFVLHLSYQNRFLFSLTNSADFVSVRYKS